MATSASASRTLVAVTLTGTPNDVCERSGKAQILLLGVLQVVVDLDRADALELPTEDRP